MTADHQNAIAAANNVTKLVGLPTYSELIEALRSIQQLQGCELLTTAASAVLNRIPD